MPTNKLVAILLVSHSDVPYNLNVEENNVEKVVNFLCKRIKSISE
jgi:hypothetical protein